MVNKVKEFVDEQTEMLTEQARTLGKASGKAVRGAAGRSAKRLKALKEPVRVVTHSGVQLTNVSHAALLDLMALQLEVVTSALSDAASQLERVAQSQNVQDLVRGQADALRAARERIVKDMSRAVAIVSDAGRDVRDVATETYGKVVKPAKTRKAKRPVRRPAAAKRAVRKTTAKSRAKRKTRR